MRICYFGTYDLNQSRNRIMIEALKSQNVEVYQCHAELWGDVHQKIVEVKKGFFNIGLLIRYMRVIRTLINNYRNIGNYDVLLLGYAGYLDVPFARLLSWIDKKPLVFDVLNSLSEGIIEDRELVSKSSVFGKLIYLADKILCMLPDLILVDNKVHAEYFASEFGLINKKIKHIPAGAEAAFLGSTNNRKSDQTFRVVYFGRFLPHHGVKQIISAARILKNYQDIRFIFIGKGEKYEQSLQTALEWSLDNVEFHYTWLSPEELREKFISNADVCLGNFGKSSHAFRVVPHKVFAAMAAGKAVITGDGPAARQVFENGDGVLLCPRGNPEAIAENILRLKNNPNLCNSLGKNARESFNERFSYQILGRELKRVLTQLADST